MSDPAPLPELVPMRGAPAGMRRFAHERRGGIADVTPTGRLRLDTIARWVQDVAWADVDDAGMRGIAVWVVRRTRVVIHRFPRIDECCALSTYVSGIGRMWAERRTDIVRVGKTEPDVQVSCVWVHLDVERLTPTAVTAAELATWCGPATPQVKARLHHPAPPTDRELVAREWIFRASELDLAAHINNAAYLTPFDDELLGPDGTAPDPAGLDLEVEYRAGAQAGSTRVLADGPWRWIVDEAGEEVLASARLTLLRR